MEYFFYCRDNPATRQLRTKLTEAHWSFMDGYAAGMIARGPTLSDDGANPTGSLHIVDLPDAKAAQVFAYEEPNYKAGVYGEVMVRRWQGALMRKMWAFKGDPDKNQRFLVIGHARASVGAIDDELREADRAFMAEHYHLNHLIVGGSLLSNDGIDWVGTALTVELPARQAVEAMLAVAPFTKAGLYDRIEIHRWRFGGRPDAVHAR